MGYEPNSGHRVTTWQLTAISRTSSICPANWVFHFASFEKDNVKSIEFVITETVYRYQKEISTYKKLRPVRYGAIELTKLWTGVALKFDSQANLIQLATAVGIDWEFCINSV